MAYAGFQFLPLVVKSSSKKVQITSLMHIAVAPSNNNNNSDASIDPRSCLTLRRVRLATLLRKASFGRLHIILLNGSTSTTTTKATAPVQRQSSSRHNNNDNMQHKKRCLFCTDPQKVQLRIGMKEKEDAGGGGGDTRAGKKCRRRLLHSQMCSDMLAVATLLHGNGPRAAAEVAVPSLDSFSLTHSLTSASIEYFN